MKLKTPTFPRKSHHPEPAAPAPAAAAMPPTRPVATPASAASPASPLRKAAGGLVAPARQRNTAVMIVGVVFILLAAAIGASVAAAFDDSVDVLVAADSIAEGQLIQSSDFRVVQIAASAGAIEAVDPESIDDLVGRVAAGPIGEGSLVHLDQFADSVEEQQILVGASLRPNQYPANGLKPGDQVRLIAVGGTSTDFLGRGDSGGAQEIAIGSITHVTEQATGNEIHVSIRVNESSANIVAQLISQNKITLGLVDQSIRVDRVDPLEAEDPVTPLTLEPAE